MSLPPVTALRQSDTHRLIPSKFGESVLTRIADDDDHLAAIFDLDSATNDRLLAEANLLPGIGMDELVFAIPRYSVINAAFTHAHPLGSRFNGPDRGAWYAGFEVETSIAEIAFHKSVELAETDWFEESLTYGSYLADFSGDYHDVRGEDDYIPCLDPHDYGASQRLAGTLLDAGSNGIVYPSVRRRGGTCIACFRPALVHTVRPGETWRFTWSGGPKPEVTQERAAP